MRSDREEVPDGFTKEDADKAETMEARILRARVATGCQVYWPAPYEVCGAIRDKYNSLGGPNSFLLWPTTNELTNPDGYGKRTVFQNGPIYWSPQGGAHPVVNHFFAAWQRNGWEAGVLGYPTTDEIVNPDPVLPIGRRQEFTGGSVYWRLNEAWYVTGAIREKWGQMGWEQSPALGYPMSDEIVLPDGVGRMNRFERGVIYWHPEHGAHPVYRPILDIWEFRGYERSRYGYPIRDPEVVADGLPSQQFQFDKMTFLEPKTVSGDNLPLYFELDRTTTEMSAEDGKGMMRVDARWTPEPIDEPDMVRPIAWGIKFHEPLWELGRFGGQTPTSCTGTLTRNGAADPWHYSKIGSAEITLDYHFHSVIPKNSFDEEIAISVVCDFPGDVQTMEVRTRMYVILRDRGWEEGQ